jgi:chromosome segregation ATPase
MHNCTCCEDCQQELQRLRAQYQSLLLDYPALKQKANMARQTMNIYKDENAQLNRTRVDLQARVAALEGEVRGVGVGSGVGAESAEARREGRKVDELVRILNCKNSEIVSLKQEASWKNYELNTLRRKVEELDAANVAYRNRVRVLENLTQNATIVTQNEKSRAFDDTSPSLKQLTQPPTPSYMSRGQSG